MHLDALIEDHERTIEAGRERVRRSNAAARSKRVDPATRTMLREQRAALQSLSCRASRAYAKKPRAYADLAVLAALGRRRLPSISPHASSCVLRRGSREDTETVNTRRHARIAAPGILRETLEVGHPHVVRCDPAGATITCSRCGADAAHDWDRISEIDFRCSTGRRLDQDRNNAANMLARYLSSGAVVSE